MSTQADVQKLIQGLAPGAVNNGNPNTVYNTPATVMNTSPGPNLASIPATPLNLPPVQTSPQLGAWQAPHDQTALNMPQWKIMQPAQPATAPPPVVTPPPGTTPGDTTVPISGGLHGNNWIPSDLSGVFDEGSVFHNPFNIDDPEIQARIGLNSVPTEVRNAITNNKGQIDSSKVDSVLTDMMPKDGKGKIDWLEALDRLTEIFPILNGVNWHDSDTGKINLASSALQVVANAIGLGPIFKFFMSAFSKAKAQAVGGATGGGACVTVDSRIFGYGRAGNVKVGDTLKVIDPFTFELSDARVSYSEAKSQPVVRITTKEGFALECSKSAPICDDTGEEILAENLLGVSIPVSRHGMIEFEVVMKVEDLGKQLVQHITCENNYFLAGEDDEAYALHHNAKKPPTFGNLDARVWDGIPGSGSGWGSELDFGNTGGGIVTVGGPTQLR